MRDHERESADPTLRTLPATALVLLHDVKPDDDIDELVDMAMRAIHGDEPWPEDDAEDLDGELVEDSRGGQSHDEDLH
jgi:hypothetical protein